jgi:hypothetical protein
MDAIFSRPNPAVGTVLRVMGLASFRSRDLAHKADTSIHGFTGQLILDEACYVIRCRLGRYAAADLYARATLLPPSGNMSPITEPVLTPGYFSRIPLISAGATECMESAQHISLHLFGFDVPWRG